MEPNEEWKDEIEKAREPFDRKVGGSMAIVAAVLTLVGVYGHISTTEELLAQQKASDQWAFYQAKALRRYQSEVAKDLLTAMNGAATAELREKHAKSIERYQKEGEEIQVQAREFEQESHISGRRSLRLHMGEVFLQMALVLASLAILTKRRSFWIAGLSSATIGALVAATALIIHG